PPRAAGRWRARFARPAGSGGSFRVSCPRPGARYRCKPCGENRPSGAAPPEAPGKPGERPGEARVRRRETPPGPRRRRPGRAAGGPPRAPPAPTVSDGGQEPEGGTRAPFPVGGEGAQGQREARGAPSPPRIISAGSGWLDLAPARLVGLDGLLEVAELRAGED